MKSGVELIAEERQRQIEKEGWTLEHDKLHHANGELSMAAAAYALHPMEIHLKNQYAYSVVFERLRPFGYDIDKKKTELRKLVIAGALIAAEIDRLQAESKQQ